MDLSKIESALISEIQLEPIQAKTFLAVTCNGKMSVEQIASHLNISNEIAFTTAKKLVELGAFIEIENVFEAMHPRFTAVNMYRRMCERTKITFKRNKIVDNIGIVLEKIYDDARTK